MDLKVMATKAAWKLKKHLPEILMATGVICEGAAIVTACVQTTKASDILEEHNRAVEEAHKAREVVLADGHPEKYTEKDEKANVLIAYRNTGWQMTKLYALPAALTGLSLACYFGAYGVLKKRLAAATAAYSALYGVFKTYRQRVREEEGYDKDYHYMTGSSKAEIGDGSLDKKGKPITKEVEIVPSDQHSQYLLTFKPGDTDYTGDPTLDRHFLLCQQQTLNDQLGSTGHVFANDLMDLLQQPHFPEGQLIGWLRDGAGDGFVDLRIREVSSVTDDGKFFTYYTLDPNYDGEIWDSI